MLPLARRPLLIIFKSFGENIRTRFIPSQKQNLMNRCAKLCVEVVHGPVGAAERQEFTIIGDTIDLLHVAVMSCQERRF